MCGEESPDSIGQDAPANKGRTLCDIEGDGKCHRKDTVPHIHPRRMYVRDKGEKVV